MTANDPKQPVPTEPQQPTHGMPNRARTEDLLTILSIGHDTSMRGEGLSLNDALKRSRYLAVRPGIYVDEIISALKDDPNLVLQWITYSEDKRTSGGWYILAEKNEIGQITSEVPITTFDSIEEAVAHYVLHELDFWASLDANQ
jgi:hypothetical protein